MITLFFTFLIGILFGGGFIYFVLKARISGQKQMIDTFKALALDSLHKNSSAFLQMAESKLQQKEEKANSTLDKKTIAIDNMIKPVQETLLRMDKQLKDLEVKREGAYKELAEMVTSSRESQIQLRQETSKLLQALRAPTGRGRWGELQLQRILEMTGMSSHSKDFSTQVTIVDENNKSFRPDVVVSLPGDRCVIIDSKVPLSAYLDAVQSDDNEIKNDSLKKHAKQLKDHIKVLGNKNYWDKINGTAEFVVLFLPGEHFLSAALEGDPELMEYSMTNKVVLATPMTLIALLRTVASGWQQEKMHENIMEMVEIGRKLYDSLNVFSSHMEKVGSRLSGAVDFFNKMVGSYDRNVMSKARNFAKTGLIAQDTELNIPKMIDKEPRIISKDDSDIIEKKDAV